MTRAGGRHREAAHNRLKASSALALATILSVGCSDAYWIKRASAAYVYAEARYKEKCVAQKGPPSCPAERAELQRDYDTITDSIDAVSKSQGGKLPKPARAKLKEIVQAREK